MVRAHGSYPWCHWFKSSHRYHMARWRSGLTHQPLTLAFMGSNPIRVTIISHQKSSVCIAEDFFIAIDKSLFNNYNIIMETLIFEWDENKNIINREKHKISFEEAQTVFYDENALLIDDPEHSQDEERFIILGFSQRANLLVVCHCYRASETVIRIISARKATKIERSYYNK